MEIPPFLVDSHDMTVDFILTPTRILQCRENLPRPTGIIWDKLTAQRIKEIPILNVIMDMEKQKGKTIVLKLSDENDGGRRGGGGGDVGRGQSYRGGGRGGRGGVGLADFSDDFSGRDRGASGGSRRTWRGERGRGGRGRGGDRRNIINDVCFNCQSRGHWSRDCPIVSR